MHHWMWWRMWLNYLTLMPAQMTQMTKLMMNKLKHKQTHKLNEYPSCPYTSGRIEAMASDCPIGVDVVVVIMLRMCFWHRFVFFLA